MEQKKREPAETDFKTRVVEVLKLLEWSSNVEVMPPGMVQPGAQVPACPICKGLPPDTKGWGASALGHRPDCTLKAAIAEAR